MADATWDTVLIIAQGAPDIIAIIDVAHQDFFLAQASRRFTIDQYGDFAEEIQAHAAAHYAQMAQTDPAGKGPISSESVGGVSVSYTLPVNNTPETYGETQFGRILKKMMKEHAPPNLLAINPI